MTHRKNSNCGSPQIWEWERWYINTHLSLDLLHGYVSSTLLATVVGTWESQELLTLALASPKNLSEMQDLSPAPDLLNLCPQRYTEGGEAVLLIENLVRVWPHHTQPVSFLCVSHCAKSFILLSHLILPSIPKGGNYNPWFTGEEVETWRG